MRRLNLLIALLSVLVGGLSVRGQEATAVEPELGPAPAGAASIGAVLLTGTDSAPTIDGRPDEAVWELAAVIESFTQVLPVEGAAPSQRTEIRILYDRDSLYFGIRCFDTEPERIIATQMRRGGSLDPDDRVAFVIDPFYDQRNGYLFGINPAGAKVDALLDADGRTRDDWDGIWYGRATIADDGWTAEVAIPFKTLSFNPRTTRWGFNVQRVIRRENETVRWTGATLDQGFTSVSNAGVLSGIEDIHQGLGLDIKPYALTRLDYSNLTDDTEFEAEAGLDIFYKVTPSTTAALTLNTDFAETEVDDRRVNLTRFPLFFPEKRDFFLQDAGIFAFGGIRRNPLPFHSRRIGIGPDGTRRDILAGVKVTGREGPVNFGFLNVQMQHDDELGDKNLLVGRAAVNVLEESTVGFIFTRGDPAERRQNMVGGVDFNFLDTSFMGDKTLEAHAWFLRSETSGMDGDQSSFGGSIRYPNDRVRWDVGFGQIDDQYDAALGFNSRTGIREYFGSWRYRWRPEDSEAGDGSGLGDWVRSIDAGVRAFHTTNLNDEIESGDINVELMSVVFESDDRFEANYSFEREVLDDPFEISDGVIIPVGDHRFQRYNVEFQSSRGRPLSVRLEFAGGEFFTGDRFDYRASAEWRMSRHVTLGAEFEMNEVDLPEGSFITRIARSRINFFFTPDLSWTNFVQYDNSSDTIGWNSRFRWIVEPGSELFLVLNQSFDQQLHSTGFVLGDTELTAKIGWTWRF